MKTERIIWGLIFVFIGGVLLLDNFGVIDFHWDTLWRFWPLVLIIIGANMLFSRENSGRAGAAAIIITFAALAFIAYQGTRPDDGRRGRWFYREDDSETDVVEGNYKSNTFSETISPGISRAELNISGGATSYIMEDSTSNLFDAEVKQRFGNYSLTKIIRDSVDVLNFKMNGKQKWSKGDGNANKVQLKLSQFPVWDINFEVGAGKIDFDLSSYKVRNLRFEGGAASMRVKLGEPQGTTNVAAETGVSDIEISIPKSAACQIRLDSGLSSNDFEGFNKQADGTFITPGFSSAVNKIIINLEGGLSKFEVNRY